MTPITEKELTKRFAYRAPNEDRRQRHERIRMSCLNLAENIVKNTKPGREQAMALTKVEEAMFHANSAIAREE